MSTRSLTRAADTSSFVQRFGAWGIVAGASEGLGAAFAESLAARGLNVLLVARRRPELEQIAERLRKTHAVEIRTLVVDLGARDAIDQVRAEVNDLEVGVAVYNAAFAPVGAFMDNSPDQLASVVDVNVRGPLLLSHALAGPMVARGRGAIVLMSSLAGMQGTPTIAAYAASKAFNRVLAEGLWAELGEHGINVLVTTAGAIRTPGYQRLSKREAPGALDPEQVAEQTLEALGRGPSFIPGFINRVAALFVGRLLPRRLAIAIMGASTRKYS